MARIVRLTESDIQRIIRKVISEQEMDGGMEDSESPVQTKSCSTVVKRTMKKIADSLTPEEINAISMEFRKLGKERFGQKIENIVGNGIMENTQNTKFIKAIHKLSKILAFSSVGFMGAATLVLPCFEGVDLFEHPPTWLQDLVSGGLMASLPLAFASIIVMTLTKEEED